MNWKRDVEALASIGWRTWHDLLRAAIELGIANIRLRLEDTDTILGSATKPSPVSRSIGYGETQTMLIDRVSYAIPRVGARVPWKADCLVQALAAQRWLGRKGIKAEIQVGVRKSGQSPLEAHAWVTVGDRVVVGGNSDGYEPMAASKTRRA